MRGVLLMNLGTPDAPTTAAVRSYLREFLSDPFVIDIPALPRWLLVNLIIAPFRSPKSAEAYRAVWTEEGSPLLVHSEALRDALQLRMGEDWKVAIGMRYGSPSTREALEELEGAEEIVAVPLYPQFARASTLTARRKLEEELKRLDGRTNVRIAGDFYEDGGFIKALAAAAGEILSESRQDHLLMSYHGLPVHQLPCAGDPTMDCINEMKPCKEVHPNHPSCYRAQSYATSRALAEELGLEEGSWSVSFQSRLGNRPWIQPFTDLHIDELLEKGCRRLAVICPSFVADNLETLEEIGIRLREDFLAKGGESLELVTCMNSHPAWVEALEQMVHKAPRTG
jgi:protoporphyrin/coproporphyrin ferrochelatase